MPIPPLKATRLQTSGEVAVLNRWADRVKQAIDDLKVSVVKKQANINLKTNNVANQTQDILNLKAGANISLTPDPFGAVIISSTSGGDGLVHGDAIWELDPAWAILREDFNNPPSVPGPTTATTFGQGLAWTIAQSGTYTQFCNGPFPLNGVLVFGAGAAANTGLSVKLVGGSSSGGNGIPLLDYPGWKQVWIFQIIRNNSSSPAAFSWSKVSLYVGLGNFVSGNPTAGTARPPYFMGLRYDTDNTAPSIGDTQFVFEYVNNVTNAPLTRNNTQGTTFSTGITVNEGRVYRFEMSCIADGQVKFLLTDGVSTASNTMTVSQISFSGNQPTFTNTNGTELVTWAGGNTLPIELGTKVTIAGGSISAGNGTFTHSIPRGAVNELFFLGTGIAGTDTGATTKFYPGLTPYFYFGNDSQATPTGNSKGILLDFMSLIWNKGLTGGVTNSQLPRYW